MTKIICDMCGKEIKSQDLKTIYLSSPVAKEVCSSCCSKLDDFFTEECYKNFVKEHHIITNVDKFIEIFGFEPYTDLCILEKSPKCNKCIYKGATEDGTCCSKWWNEEYKEPSEV